MLVPKDFLNVAESYIPKTKIPLKAQTHTNVGGTFVLRVVTLVRHKEGLWSKSQYVS